MRSSAAAASEPVFEVQAGEAPPGWDDAVATAPGGLFHEQAWARYQCHAGRADPLWCTWSETGEIVARALGLRRPPGGSRAGRVAGYLFFDSAPVTTRIGLDLVTPLKRWARGQRWLLKASLGSFDAVHPWTAAYGYDQTRRLEFLVEAKDGDALWEGMKRWPRQTVRRAQEGGVKVVSAGGTPEAEVFADLYAQTLDQLRERKGVEGAQVAREEFAASLEHLLTAGRGRLYIARGPDEEPEGGAFFGVWRGGAFYLYGGAAPQARKSGAGVLVLFEAMRDLLATGTPRINLGGTPAEASDPESPDHGLYSFKRRFGAQVVERTSLSLALRPGRAAAVRLARRILRM
jgi:Acetyltransferase (GNAT) domain